MKIRLTGTTTELAQAAALLADVLTLTEVSDTYPNRDNPDARLYLTAQLPTRETSTQPPGRPPAAGPAKPAPSSPVTGPIDWDTEVAELIRTEFRDDIGAAIVHSDAFGALVYRIRQATEDHQMTAHDVLHAIDPDDRGFIYRAVDPAAFLAAKIRDL